MSEKLTVNKLRVAFVSMHTCPLAMLGGKKSGGMNVYVRELAKTLGRLGVQVDVFTRLQSKCQPQISYDLGEGVRVIHVKAGPIAPMGTIEMSDHVPEFVKGMLEVIGDDALNNANGYDIIHSHYWLSGLVAEEFNSQLNVEIPIVQMFHTLGELKNAYAIKDEDKVNPKRISCERKLIQDSVNQIIVSSNNEKTELVKYYGANDEIISIVPPGVDLERFKPKDRDLAKQEIRVNCGDQLVLFAGRIEKLKGIDTVLYAMDVLENWSGVEALNKCVVIVGGDPWNEDPEPEMVRLQQITKDLGIGEHVVFVGAKDQMSLPNYYAAADVIVMPSHYESFGMVALEAMAMGRPVIASEVGGLAELVEDGVNGLHVDSRDPEGLAKAINEILSDEGFRIKLGQSALQTAKQYDWTKIANRILDIYKELV